MTVQLKPTIEFDALAQGYRDRDIQALLRQVSSSNEPVSITLSNAHYLTTKASMTLHEFICDHPEIGITVNGDRAKIFPPLLGLTKKVCH